MAPIQTHTDLEDQLKNIIQDLYNLMVQTSTYDTTARPSRDVLSRTITQLSASLASIHRTASADPTSSSSNTTTNNNNANNISLAGLDGSPVALPQIPPELIQYVENGRNPDIYTREFVELVRRGNQLMKGKMGAFAEFEGVLAGEMARAMPDLRGDVERVLGRTAGEALAEVKKEEGS